jgi:hypothetical protein
MPFNMASQRELSIPSDGMSFEPSQESQGIDIAEVQKMLEQQKRNVGADPTSHLATQW